MDIFTMPPLSRRVGARNRTSTRGNPSVRRAWPRALARGLLGHCPACGRGRLFTRGLRVVRVCPHCGEELYHQRGDRLTLPIAAFVALQLLLMPMLPLSLLGVSVPAWTWWVWPLSWAGLTALLARPVKGGIVGLQWALRLHGFQYAAMCRPHRR